MNVTKFFDRFLRLFFTCTRRVLKSHCCRLCYDFFRFLFFSSTSSFCIIKRNSLHVFGFGIVRALLLRVYVSPSLSLLFLFALRFQLTFDLSRHRRVFALNERNKKSPFDRTKWNEHKEETHWNIGKKNRKELEKSWAKMRKKKRWKWISLPPSKMVFHFLCTNQNYEKKVVRNCRKRETFCFVVIVDWIR